MRLVGNLVDWNGRKACGFIEVPSMGKKYFAHKTEFQIQFSDFQGPPPNLSFVPGMDPKSGKERACQILPEGAYESPMSGMSDEPRLHGVLAQWQPQKACGFIDWDGKRVFAHKSEFELAFPDGAAPPLGSQVSFVLGTDPKSGKERACSIRLQAGSMPAAAMRRQQPQRSFFGGGCCGGCGGCVGCVGGCSAYGCGGCGCGGGLVIGGGGCSYAAQGTPPQGQPVLDEKAVQTLRELPPQVADAILMELQNRGNSIQNPSAYVQRSAANARRGEGAAAAAAGGALSSMAPSPMSMAASLPPLAAPSGSRASKWDLGPAAPTGRLSEQLDERALTALKELTPQAAQAILNALDEQVGRVQNPSAYVIKAVGNARRGEGIGGRIETGGVQATPMGASFMADPFESATVEGLMAPWRSLIDVEAQRALEGAGFQAVQHIIGELEAKRDQIRNPSAYVSKSVANFKNGQTPPGTGGVAAAAATAISRSGPEDEQVRFELNQELSRLPVPLDEKALDALNEVGVRAGLAIIKMLHQQGNKVNNPNAYVMRSCANERKGMVAGAAGFGSLPDPKRQRLV
mmetsp:Transcript_161175/g.517373  ORF Transcript_161175/g.517373 Transcript_161175/m.517373 type:complete len:574 (+) Transcript_161175:157-1878(+)